MGFCRSYSFLSLYSKFVTNQQCEIQNPLKETWSGMKSSESHFKVFGCVDYTNVTEMLRRKLYSISEN